MPGPRFSTVELLEPRLAPASVAVIELSSLDGTDGFKIAGESAGDLTGISVSDAGDINGDGFGDLLIGGSGASPHGSESGAAYVMFGKPAPFAATRDLSALDGANGFKIRGEGTYDSLGRSVSGAGDVNGDGFDDLIVGAPYANSNGDGSGAAYVIFGKGTPFGATVEVSSLNGNRGFRMNGAAADDGAGISVSGAGDVNGDGFDDLLIGAYGASGPTGTGAGAAYIVFGGSAFPATLELSSLNGSNGFRVNGAAAGDALGRAVSGAGDVNGDGFADVVVGAYDADPNGAASGAAYVIFGKSTPFFPTVDVSSLDGREGFRINGAAAGDYSGASVAGAGDINGDGLADLLIGAYHADGAAAANSGISYVVFGAATFAPTIELSSLDGANGFQIHGEAAGDDAGTSVSGAGDVNGDGVDDLLIGAPATDARGSDSGSTYLIFGRRDPFPVSLDLSTLDGANGFQIDGEGDDDSAGGAVSGAGDVNGDGFDDLVIGAAGAQPNGEYSGASYVLLGRANATSGPKVTIVNANTATFIDADGDLVTVSVTRGALSIDDFVLEAAGVGAQLQTIDFHDDVVVGISEFFGTDLTVTAVPTALGGNSLVNVGYVDARGVDLGRVTIGGDLGQVDAGDASRGAAIRRLVTESFGAAGLATQGNNASGQSDLAGKIKALTVHTDVMGVTLNVSGGIGSLDQLGDRLKFRGGIEVGGAIDTSSIHSGRVISRITVGTEIADSVFTALGRVLPSTDLAALAFGKIKTGGAITNSDFLAGYTAIGTPFNGDASVGRLTVGTDWLASNLIAGVVDSTGDGFGQNDQAIGGGTPDVIARIAHITIRGAARGNPTPGDHFGISAQQIDAAIVGPSPLLLTHLRDEILLDPRHGDLRLREV